MRIDLFCHVIDYFGDVAVLYRLAKALLRLDSSLQIRFFCTHPKLVQALYPNQQKDNIQLLPFSQATNNDNRIDVAIEGFACKLPSSYRTPPVVINLEYLSAESWVGEYHTLESIGMNPNGKKFFFFPSFDNQAGGLTHGQFVHQLIQPSATNESLRQQLMQQLALPQHFIDRPWVLLYLYEVQNHTLHQLADRYALIMISTQAAPIEHHWLTAKRCSQAQFDQLLIVSDIALIRGEDSLSRAVLGGKPFVWQAYRQAENAHYDKLNALHQRLRQLSPSYDQTKWLALQWQLNQHNDVDVALLDQLDPNLFAEYAKQLQSYASLESNLLSFMQEKLAAN